MLLIWSFGVKHEVGISPMSVPHHLQQVLLQRLHSSERFHLQHATCPVDQSRLTRRSLQTEPQPPRQDLISTNTLH